MLIIVDLDGSLISTDVSAESVLGFLRHAPLRCLLSLPMLLAGRARFKAEVVDAGVPFDADTLPYRQAVLDFLRSRKEQGDRLVLVTASHQSYADAVALHLGIFEAAYGSTAERNLKAEEKLRFIREKFGEEAFGYVGDSAADIPIWAASALPVIVAPKESSRAKKLLKQRSECVHLSYDSPSLDEYFRPMRPHQWAKNILLFVPAALAHKLPGGGETGSIVLFQLLTAFLAFSLCSSAVYVFNDLLDVQHDRKHPSKKRRAFAAGTLPPQWGMLLMLILLAASSMLANTQAPDFVVVLDVYLIATLLYTLRLKRIPVIDIVLLAGLYTLRIIAGGVVAGVLVSQWLKAFAMFLFLSLACIKRASELLVLKGQNREHASGRGYRADDLDLVIPVGVSSGLLSTLVLALYINSNQGEKLYGHPERLWWVCPILLTWLLRSWFLTKRGEMNDDPVVFALTDVTSYLLGALAVISILYSL